MATALPRPSVSRDLAVSWIAAAAVVLLVYLAVVVGGSRLLGDSDSTRLALSLTATVTVAVGIEPLQRRLRATAARHLARPTTEPYEVLSRFGERLAGAESVEEM